MRGAQRQRHPRSPPGDKREFLQPGLGQPVLIGADRSVVRLPGWNASGNLRPTSDTGTLIPKYMALVHSFVTGQVPRETSPSLPLPEASGASPAPKSAVPLLLQVGPALNGKRAARGCLGDGAAAGSAAQEHERRCRDSGAGELGG